MPTFKKWLYHLEAGVYLNGFLNAGYDLEFISRHGLSEVDLDCVGIPVEKLGLRRKLLQLYHLDRFYSIDNESDEEEDIDEVESEESEEES